MVGRAAPAALSPLFTGTYVNSKKHGQHTCNLASSRYNLGVNNPFERLVELLTEMADKVEEDRKNETK